MKAIDHPVIHTEKFERQGAPMANAQTRAADWCLTRNLSIGTREGGADVGILVGGDTGEVTVHDFRPI